MNLDEQTTADAIALIRNTLAEYCHTIDDGRFDAFAECFAPDARVHVMGQTIDGREAIRAWMERAMPPERRGRHVTANTRIEVERDHATAVTDFLFYAKSDEGWRVTQLGRYLDRLAEVDGRWRLTEREIVLGAVPLA